MIFSLTPPSSTPIVGVANTNTPSHRERDDDYAYLVVQLAPRYRVILCPQGLQWIIQEKEASHEGPWRAEGYYTSRNNLLKACGKLDFLSDAYAEAVLHALPEYARDYSKK